MATVDKNFRVKNGINVAGTATVSGTATFESDINVNNQLIINSAPVAFDQVSNRLQIFINDEWKPIAFLSEVSDLNNITFMDLGLAIDYNGQPVYTLQANGVLTSGIKFADGGDPLSTAYSFNFDSGTI